MLEKALSDGPQIVTKHGEEVAVVVSAEEYRRLNGKGEKMDFREFLIVGIEWERGWRYGLTRTEGVLWLQVDIGDLRHDLGPSEKLQSPPVFLAHGGADVISRPNANPNSAAPPMPMP